MKFVIAVVLACVAVSAAQASYSVGSQLLGGVSSQFRSEDNYGNYNFGYDESHATGGSSRREEESNGVRRGAYSLSDADGRHRVVNYIADATGFHATVETNEPGVEPKDPADVLINKNGYAVAAPVAAAPIVAAPVAAYAPRVAASYAAPAYAPAPIAAPAYANRGFFAARAAPAYAPAPIVAAPAYAPAPIIAAPEYIEAETPRAFSYSFGANHVAPAAYAPAVYQNRLAY